MSQQFKFKVGQRVWYQPESFGRKYPGSWVRVLKRTIEPVLGKTYQIRGWRKALPFVPEDKLSPEKPDDAV